MLYMDVNLNGTIVLLEAARRVQPLPTLFLRARHPSALKPEPMPAADMTNTGAGISKARELLGYNPVVSVAEGVKAFLASYEKMEH